MSDFSYHALSWHFPTGREFCVRKFNRIQDSNALHRGWYESPWCPTTFKHSLMLEILNKLTDKTRFFLGELKNCSILSLPLIYNATFGSLFKPLREEIFPDSSFANECTLVHSLLKIKIENLSLSSFRISNIPHYSIPLEENIKTIAIKKVVTFTLTYPRVWNT